MKSMCSILILLVAASYVNAHGRLWEPPGRSTIWRTAGYGYLPHNYNDNELFCGGYAVQHEENGGRCGICGDNYANPTPRENENGGVYGRGVVARTYNAGAVIDARVQITSNHLGYLTFALCPLNADKTENDAGCVSLPLADGSGYKFQIGDATGFFDVPLRLPEDFRSGQATFQWTYTTGNSWGWCDAEQTHGAIGCGAQETFRSCADIAIV